MDINEFRGLLAPTAEDKQQALKMGLIQAGIGLLGGSKGSYGALAPALSQGMGMGVKSYQDTLDQAKNDRMQNFGLQTKLDEMQKQQDDSVKMNQLIGGLNQGTWQPTQFGTSADGIQDPTKIVKAGQWNPPSPDEMKAKLLQLSALNPAAGTAASHVLSQFQPKEPEKIDHNKPFLPNGQPNIPYQNWAIREKSTGAAPDSTMQLTPDAIEVAAQRYLTDGTLPPMGMGKNGTVGRASILNRAAEVAKGYGESPESQRITQLANKAIASALNQLQKQQTIVSAFEENATKNADMALKLSDQVDRTGIPILNQWIQAGQKSVAGNPQVSQFHAATETFVNEYAKIMSGSMGNTTVSDSARAHAHSLLSTAQSKEQYKAVVSTLKQEMGNRMSGFEDEKQALLQSMTRQTKPSQSNVIKFDANGNMVTQ